MNNKVYKLLNILKFTLMTLTMTSVAFAELVDPTGEGGMSGESCSISVNVRTSLNVRISPNGRICNNVRAGHSFDVVG
ncbi:MAG: hypothetical protein HRT44_10515, partial [Bdellovibrionales bacterium]|nr:hypothetical protein [Bdellovibrionales bacterium]NQZ19673.1 hypothetical protein [Bdellovibrionales bacterium]